MTKTIEFTNTQCRCGCGQVLSGKKSRFAQGHDARFVSAMRTEALESEKGLHAEVTLIDRSTDPATQTMVSVKNAVEELGSTALMEKLISGFRKEQGRQEERAKREAAKAIAKENAKDRRTSAAATKATKGAKAKSPAEQAAEVADGANPVEVPVADVADLDAITEAAPAIDLDSLAPAEATVEGEAPVSRKNGGRTRRGNLNSQG